MCVQGDVHQPWFHAIYKGDKVMASLPGMSDPEGSLPTRLLDGHGANEN
jgi:hypothetical protein